MGVQVYLRQSMELRPSALAAVAVALLIKAASIIPVTGVTVVAVEEQTSVKMAAMEHPTQVVAAVAAQTKVLGAEAMAAPAS